MGKSQYLIDTNVIIDYLNGKLPPKGTTFVSNIVDDEFSISIITKIEVLGYKNLSEDEYRL